MNSNGRFSVSDICNGVWFQLTLNSLPLDPNSPIVIFYMEICIVIIGERINTTLLLFFNWVGTPNHGGSMDSMSDHASMTALWRIARTPQCGVRCRCHLLEGKVWLPTPTPLTTHDLTPRPLTSVPKSQGRALILPSLACGVLCSPCRHRRRLPDPADPPPHVPTALHWRRSPPLPSPPGRSDPFVLVLVVSHPDPYPIAITVPCCLEFILDAPFDSSTNCII